MFSKKARSNSKRFVKGAAIAALAGYITGVLTAPKSGRQTRNDIKNTTQKGLTDAEKELKKLHTELTELIDDVKATGNNLNAKATHEVNDLVDTAKSSKEKARELLSALHEGDAEDRELRRAIRDANKAVAHLRKFLKK